MNPAQLLTWLKEPSSLDKDSLLPLRSVIDDFPCFTVARMLYLKNLAQLNDVRYTSELVKTAIAVPDRRKLYLFMEERPEESLPGLKTVGSAENRDFSLIDRFLHHVSVQEADDEQELSDNYVKPNPPSVDLDVATGGDDQHGLNTINQTAIKTDGSEAMTPVEDLGLGAFSLDYPNYQVLYDKESTESAASSPSPPMQGQALIDAYLSGGHEAVEAGIPAQPVTTKTVLADTSTVNGATTDAPLDDESLETMTSGLPEASFSEALARIYVKQKRYDRALEIIKSLRLKYPEKNRYFADQIRYLEQLINSTNQY